MTHFSRAESARAAQEARDALVHRTSRGRVSEAIKVALARYLTTEYTSLRPRASEGAVPTQRRISQEPTTRDTGPRSDTSRGPVSPRRVAVPLSRLLDLWLDESVITASQAARIRARQDADVIELAPGSTSATRVPLSAEALGYLGGVVVVVGALLVANLYWDDLASAIRLSVVGGAAVLLLLGGWAVPRRPGDVGVRLRAVLWLAATIAFAGFLGLLGAEAFGWSGSDTAVLTTSGTAVAAAMLWSMHRHLVQQLATLVALMATASALVADLVTPDHLPGAGAWLVAAVWLGLAWLGFLVPRRAVMDVAAAGLLVGSVSTLPTNGGFALALATVAAVVALAVLTTDLVMLGIGALGMLMVLPAAVAHWFPGSAGAPVAVLITGAVLVAVAVLIARRRRESGPSVR